MVKKEEIISVDFRGSSALPRALFPRTIFKYSVCMYGVWDMYVKVGRMAGNRLGNNLERLWVMGMDFHRLCVWWKEKEYLSKLLR